MEARNPRAIAGFFTGLTRAVFHKSSNKIVASERSFRKRTILVTKKTFLLKANFVSLRGKQLRCPV